MPEISFSKPKISQQTGEDSTDVTIDNESEFVEYQLRRVTSGDATINQGTLIEQGVVAPTLQQVATVTDDELFAAGGQEGDNIVKAFVRGEATYVSEETFISESTFISDGAWM